MKCEGCGTPTSGAYDLMDYCAVCSKNLCESCMMEGCCGNKPAVSGMKIDYGGTKKQEPPIDRHDDE